MRNKLSQLYNLMKPVPPFAFALLVISVVGMNMLANKSIDTGVEWLALDCGLLLSWACFLSMDILTQCYGPKTATAASLLALVFNLMMALVFFIASIVPGMWGESFVDVGGDIINTALDNTFRGTWFIILGSSIAYAVSAVVNNFLNWAIGEHLEKNGSFAVYATRSYVSTIIGQLVDNLTFALIVSRTFFGWTLLQCFTCALTGALLELLFEVFFSPIGYRVSRRLIAEETGSAGEAA